MKPTTEQIIQSLKAGAWEGEKIMDLAAGRLEELQREIDASEALKRIDEVLQQRDEARAEVKRLKEELIEAITERNKSVAELVKQRDEERAHNQFTFVRPEPSRLEIAAMVVASRSMSTFFREAKVEAKHALEAADELIAAAKEGGK